MSSNVEQFLIQRRRQIEAENEAFAAMTPEQKRVLIAKDVLQQLDYDRLMPQIRVWVSSGDLNRAAEGRLATCELQQVLLDTSYCYVCGLGALFVCAVERANKITMKESRFDITGIDGSSIFEYLNRFFDRIELAAIEAAFELGCGSVTATNHVPLTMEQFDRAKIIYPDINPEHRMRKIMQNIVDNNGTFVY